MNYVKIICFNSETIDSLDLINIIKNTPNYKSHYSIKPGILLINYRGSSKDLYYSLGEPISEQNIFIHDLDRGVDAFWGYMNKLVWDWIKENRE